MTDPASEPQTKNWLGRVVALLRRWRIIVMNPLMELVSGFACFLRLFSRILREWIGILSPCRFSVLLVVLTALFVFASGQGREFVVGLAEGGSPLTWYFVMATLAGLQTWLWARAALDAVVSTDRTQHFVIERGGEEELTPTERWMVDNTPRLLGTAVPAIGGLALAMYGVEWDLFWRGKFNWPILLPFASFIIAALLYIFFWYVSPFTRPVSWLTRWWQSWFELPTDRTTTIKEYWQLPIGIRWSFWISLVVFVIVVAEASVWPWHIGGTSGALPILLLAMALFVPLGTRFILASVRNGFPMVTLLLLWAIAISFVPFADNHAVRSIDPPADDAIKPQDRPTIKEAATDWANRVAKGHGSSHAKIPLIIVATAGGGSRAAYWTATVLGNIQDEEPGFADHVFAISGVSGGSLGAATFVSFLDKATATERYGQDFLAPDFMKPLAGSFFFPDLAQRFLPLGFPDRAEAIEKAWEHHWHCIVYKSRLCNKLDKEFWLSAKDGFAQPFLSLWRNHRESPALFLNGMHEESGRRIITSNIKIDPATFLDAFDFYDLVEGDIRISTAINNSARFTYVQPAGTLIRGGHNNGHIIDGGYFENFGAITAGQIMRHVVHYLRGNEGQTENPELVGKELVPIVIQISSDPDIDDEASLPLCAVSVPSRCDGDLPGLEPELGTTGANELSAPVAGLASSRSARGLLAAKELCHQTAGLNGIDNRKCEENAGNEPRFFHFRLCKRAGYRDPPLAWALSKHSQDNLKSHFEGCGNMEQRRALIDTLRALRPDLFPSPAS